MSMPVKISSSPKPVNIDLRPELTRLPALTLGRRVIRRLYHLIARLAIALLAKVRVQGLENFPRRGPAIVVINHLGDADAALALAYFPRQIDLLGKAELHDFPLLGWVMDAYGVVWVHRGQPDRRALRSVLNGLQAGRMFAIAPEGRESLTGALEEGTGGAAYLALKAGVPVLPVTVTGTENGKIYPALKRFRRPPVSLTIGLPFYLEELPDWRLSIEAGTRKIMRSLAVQLPREYQGIYANLED